MSKRRWMAIKRMIAWGLVFNMILPMLPVTADIIVPGKGAIQNVVPPAANALPKLQAVVEGTAVLEKPTENHLVVHQGEDKTILDWQSFNIGADAWTHFDQKGRTDWSVLNRIYDRNPSLIFGRLTADGKVFLINQNGMLFGPNAIVQTHDLVASALNISDDDFLDGQLQFKSDNYIGDSDEYWRTSTVENQGEITVGHGGTVYLLGPNVTNSGTIDAPAGHALMAAAEALTLDYPDLEDEYRSIVKDSVVAYGKESNAGTVTNHAQGRLSADNGKVNLFGRVVNQEGLIHSVTAVSGNGDIVLKATESITTGSDSKTILDVSDSGETLNRSATVVENKIEMEAPLVVHKGEITVPSGTVSIIAAAPTVNTDDPDNSDSQEEIEIPPRIYLDEGSVIDVSGKQVTVSAQSRVADIQLNSIQLRDDYGQKEGELKGTTITFDTRRGSAVGNVAEAIDNQLLTAEQHAVTGGEIVLIAHDGEVIQRQGSAFNFKGGTTTYEAGSVATTKLVSGQKIYDISEAPQWLTYDRILGTWEKRHERFGVVEKYEGPYLDGGTLLKGGISPAYTEGAAAGSLSIQAKRVVLEGSMTGAATVGPYQTLSGEIEDLSGGNATLGRARPTSGALIIGELGSYIYERDSADDLRLDSARDLSTSEVLLTAESHSMFADGEAFDPKNDMLTLTVLPDGYQPDVYTPDASLISADLLNQSNLGSIEIGANDRVAIETGAKLALSVGSSLSLGARTIENHGSVQIPAGTVSMVTGTTITSPLTVEYPDDVAQPGIFLHAGSSISVAGACTDEALVLPGREISPLAPDQADGGDISLKDYNYVSSDELEADEEESVPRFGKGVILSQGARLDVSGGYTRSAGGQITAGDAGTLALTGDTLVLEGEFIGRSLLTAEGGELTLHARTVNVQAQAPTSALVAGGTLTDIADDRVGKLILAPSQLSNTGFSELVIESQEDLTVSEGVALTPSYAKNVDPIQPAGGNILSGPTGLWDDDQQQIDGVTFLSPDMVDQSTVTLSAGKWLPQEDPTGSYGYKFSSDIQTITLTQGAQVTVASGGTISLDAPKVEIAGGLTALGGTVDVTASKQDLHIAATGEIDVSGTLIPGSQGNLQGEAAVSTPLDGGKVVLKADMGGIYADQSAQIDLSGSPAARYDILKADGNMGFEMAAGDPGSLELAFYTDLAVDAEIRSYRYLSDQPGAELTIHRIARGDTDPGMTVDTIGLRQADESTGMITLGASVNPAFGFDTLTLKSDRSLEFGNDLELYLGRQLTLDAPTIASATDGDAPLISMQAPWIKVTNTSDEMVSSNALAGGQAKLILNATATSEDFGWLDVKGSIGISGFALVDLRSAGDMVLADREYSVSGDGDSDVDNYSGRLATVGELNLTADQIYPATAADFTIESIGTIASTGKVVIDQNSDDYGLLNPTVYSAGGRLVIAAQEIHNYGRLLAPSGEIVLSNGVVVDGEGIATYTPADKVYLAPGSLIATGGADFDVAYGSLSDGEVAGSWQLSKGDYIIEETIDAAPDKRTVISAAEIVQEAGAEIDVAGSPSGIFTYEWLSGMEGSVNPLDGINVILPGSATSLPGKAVYLQGGAGIEEGIYTLLPAEYAFLPGAMVLTESGPSWKENFSGQTIEGYRTVQGYATTAGTGTRSGRLTEYTVISGERLLAKGHFTQNTYAAAQGGTISLEGDTMLLAGTMRGSGVDGALGGILELAGRDIKLEDNPQILSAGYDADKSLSDQYPDVITGTLYIGTGNLGDAGFETVQIGKLVLDSTNYGTNDNPIYQYSPDSTSTISISAGTQLKATNLVLEAVNAIEIEGNQDAGSLLGHIEETESLTLRCATGRTQLADGTLVQTRVLAENGELVAPDGYVSLAAGADLAAADTIIFDAPNLSLDGGLTVQNSTVKLMSDQITFMDGDSTDPALDSTAGLIITPDLWSKIAKNDTIELLSAGDVRFGSSADSQTDPFMVWNLPEGVLRIDTPALVNAADDRDASITLHAGQIELLNSSAQADTSQTGSGGSLSLIAEQITVGHGDLRVDGFDDVALSAVPGKDTNGSVTFQGNGSLTTDARLSVAAATVRTDLYRWDDADGNTRFEAANFTVAAGGLLAVAPVSEAAVSPDADYQGLPGTLNLTAERIEIAGLIEMPSGALHLSDQQIEGGEEGTTGGILIGNGARIHLAGGESFGGGSLNLTGSGSGSISIASGAAIDLDAGSRKADGSFDDALQGDAGSLAVTTSGGDVLLEGALSAQAASWGSGGDFLLDAQSIDNIDGLLASVAAAGFSNAISVRSRTDSLTVGQAADAPLALSASNISLSADGGALTVGNVQLTAQTSADDGGTIELYANDDLNITADAILSADAATVEADGVGGTILAASGKGRVIQQGHLSVAGASGGTVHFRALRNDDTGDAGMDLAGTITGAQSIVAEAVRVYDIMPSGDLETGLTVIDADLVDAAIDDATAFLNKATAAGTAASPRWSPELAANVQVALTPGIEFQSDADVAITGGTIDLSSRRFDNEQVAGTLTVRTKGDLNLDTALVDSPTSQTFFDEHTRTDTTGGWDFYLVAGADLQAVNRLATDIAAGQESGKLTVNERLFTHSGNVGFASAGDTEIGPAGIISMIPGISSATYTLAGYRGDIKGRVGGDLNLRQGIIQSAVGAIDLGVEKNINFTNADGGIVSDVGGAIRTLGGPTDDGDIKAVWDYQPGGTISVQAGQNINGGGLLGITDNQTLTPWDQFSVSGVGREKTTYYTADYSEGTQGIAAMAGGDVSVQAGGNIVCQIGTFEQGDLAVRSGGDIQGRYTIRRGQGDLTAFGNIGQGIKETTLELCDVETVETLAVGNVELDAVVNPTLFLRKSDAGLVAQHLSYGEDSAVGIRALEGSIGLLGSYGYFDVFTVGNNSSMESILPPIMTLAAARDITIAGEFQLSPSPQGHLSMSAGGSIIGIAKDPEKMGAIDLVDLDPASIAELYDPEEFDKTYFNSLDYRSSLLHAANQTPVTIVAGENIETIKLILPKSALIVAGQDIVDLCYFGQHMDSGDFSLIHAGGDIQLGVDPALTKSLGSGLIEHASRIVQGGNGTLLVQAGDTIDLGTSGGIQAVGNQNNKALDDQSVLLAVAAGYDLFDSFAQDQELADPTSLTDGILDDAGKITGGLSVVFEQIRQTGRIYSEMLAEERDAEAANLVAEFRRNVLHAYFPLQETDDAAPKGDLNMINSKIKATDKSEGLYIITRGDINVGRSTLPASGQTAKESGIFTEAGGGVNVYAAGSDRTMTPDNPTGNINVNESRIMTFLGGDITVWADQGDINAGRGSKGALLLPEEEVITDEAGNRIRKYKPPVQGSGIRTLTYDPDGTQGPLGPARAGDGYIFAPEGEIDAGEAGIAVANIYLAAVQYANVQNIEASGVSVGVPMMVDTGGDVDALAGTSSIADVVSASEEGLASNAKDRMDQMVNAINENLVKILNVEVVGFGADEKDGEGEDEEK